MDFQCFESLYYCQSSCDEKDRVIEGEGIRDEYSLCEESFGRVTDVCLRYDQDKIIIQYA